MPAKRIATKIIVSMAILLAARLNAATNKPEPTAAWPQHVIPATAWRVARVRKKTLDLDQRILYTKLKTARDIWEAAAEKMHKNKSAQDLVPVSWSTPKSLAKDGDFLVPRAGPGLACGYAVSLIHSPQKFRDQPYIFRIISEVGAALFINGRSFPMPSTTPGVFQIRIPAAALLAGFNRVAIKTPPGARVRVSMSHPGDVRFMATIPENMDPTHNLDTWKDVPLDNGLVTARVAVPDPIKGIVRHNRFEQSGIITSLIYNGHTYFYTPTKTPEPGNRWWGMSTTEESFKAIAWDDAKPGEPFIKLGIGLFEKSYGQQQHRWYANQWPLKFFTWEMKRESKNAILFTQTVKAPRGWAYTYRKRLVLVPGKPILRIEHELTNIGTNRITTEQYCHNWVLLDQKPTTSGYTITLPYAPQGITSRAIKNLGIKVSGNSITISPLAGSATPITGWESAPLRNNRVTITHSGTSAAITIGGDFALSQASFFACDKAVCFEPFIHLDIAPGKTQKWVRWYELK